MAFIYMIENKINGKKYIGKTRRTDVCVRWKEHISALINNKHVNRHLQNSWNYFGAANFNFSIVAEFPDDFDEVELAKQEIKYIDKFDSLRNGYNLKAESVEDLQLEKWKYTVRKNGRISSGKQSYSINGKNGDYLICSVNKELLESFIPLLNSDEELGLKAIKEWDFFKFSVVKQSKSSSGKIIYGIRDKNGSYLICSIDKNLLDGFVQILNDDKELGLKLIKEYKKADKFNYTVIKSGLLPSGNQNYCILGRDGSSHLIDSTNKDFLEFVVELLNKNEEEWVVEENAKFKLQNKKLLKELYKNYDSEVLI